MKRIVVGQASSVLSGAYMTSFHIQQASASAITAFNFSEPFTSRTSS